MTYPDQDLRTFNRRWIVTVAVLFLVIYLAFAVEARIRSEVCISAATIDESGTVTSTPVVCR